MVLNSTKITRIINLCKIKHGWYGHETCEYVPNMFSDDGPVSITFGKFTVVNQKEKQVLSEHSNIRHLLILNEK